MTRRIKYNCVFGGGGIRGMCYSGAMAALNEYGIEINSVAGSSVGAVFAVLYAAGYNEDEIKNLFIDFNLNMFRDLNINVFNTEISLSKGEIFLDWLREKIGTKVYGKNYDKNKIVTFKDLPKDLYILTLDLNTNMPYIFSKKSTPDAETAFAVRASASLPGLMKPVPYENMLLVDGDLIKTRPAWKLYDDLNNDDERILEFRLEGSRDGGEIKNPADHLNSIINTVWYLSTENIYEEYSQNDRYDFIIFDTKDVIMFDFNLSKETKEALVQKGYNDTKDFLTKTLIEKKVILHNIYIKMLTLFKTMQRELKRNNLKSAYCISNEIILYAYEHQKQIDNSFTVQLKRHKELIKSGMKKISFLRPRPYNEQEIREKTDYIIKMLETRLCDIKTYIAKNGNSE